MPIQIVVGAVVRSPRALCRIIWPLGQASQRLGRQGASGAVHLCSKLSNDARLFDQLAVGGCGKCLPAHSLLECSVAQSASPHHAWLIGPLPSIRRSAVFYKKKRSISAAMALPLYGGALTFADPYKYYYMGSANVSR